MDYKIAYTRRAQADLDNLLPAVVRKVLTKVNFFLKSGLPLKYAKKLKGLPDYYRFRVGDYRVIFRQDEQNGRLVVLVVLRIGHRKSIYRGRLL